MNDDAASSAPMLAARATPAKVSELEATLGRLYPGAWALALVTLCHQTPHRHRRDGKEVECDSPGKVPIDARWNADAAARVAAGTGRELHVRRVAAHVARIGNVGLAVPAGVLVLDADAPEHVAALDTVLPTAPRQTTRPGRAHFAVRAPFDDVKADTGVEVLPGVKADLRTAGASQIACEPSIHASGAAYTWTRPLPASPDDLPECPAEIAARLPRKGSAKKPKAAKPKAATVASAVHVEDDAERDLLRMAGFALELIAEGARNDTLHKRASSLRGRGQEEPEILRHLRRANRLLCQPPLADDEVQKIARSAGRYDKGGAAAVRDERDPEALRDFVAAQLSVPIRRVIQYGRDDPSYSLDLADGEPVHVGDSITRRVRVADALAKHRRVYVNVAPRDWPAVAQALLKLVEVSEDAEVERRGETRGWVEWSIDRERAHAGADLPAKSFRGVQSKSPFVEDDYVYVNAARLRQELIEWNVAPRSLTPAQLVARLRDVGFEKGPNSEGKITIVGGDDGTAASGRYYRAPLSSFPAL